MKHLRRDYDAIQPFPTKRPHIVKIDGKTVDGSDIQHLGRHMEPVIPHDEPVFLVRGQDPSAAAATRAWADDAEARGAAPEIVAAARTWADGLEEYAASIGKTVADAPADMLRMSVHDD
jgi:hypothetical protein